MQLLFNICSWSEDLTVCYIFPIRVKVCCVTHRHDQGSLDRSWTAVQCPAFLDFCHAVTILSTRKCCGILCDIDVLNRVSSYRSLGRFYLEYVSEVTFQNETHTSSPLPISRHRKELKRRLLMFPVISSK
jgi:hypothetical protein